MALHMELGSNLAIQLHSTLGQQIVAGEFEGKTFPSEAELAIRFDASRTVIREAMKMLTARGLINARQRGNRLNPITDWNLLDPDVSHWLRQRPFSIEAYREFIQMRLGIEPVAAGLTASLRDPVILEELTISLEGLRTPVGDSPERLKLSIRFHQALLRGSRNLFFNRLTELVATALHMETRILNATNNGLPFQEQIHACILHGDSAGAEAIMRELLRANLRQAEDKNFDPG